MYYRRFLFSACGVCEAAKATCFGLGTSKRKRDCCEEPIFIFTGEARQPQCQAGQELTEACLWAGSEIICPSQPWWIILAPDSGFSVLTSLVVFILRRVGGGRGQECPPRPLPLRYPMTPKASFFLLSLSPPASSHLIIIFKILSNDCTISPGMEIMLSSFNLLIKTAALPNASCVAGSPQWTRAAVVYEI